MPYVKNKYYLDIPFCAQTNRNEFYTYFSIEDLVVRCVTYKEQSFRCRTIGILKSINGRFFISEIKLPMKASDETKIRVSMIYLKSPPKSTFIPYTVQIFGTLTWRKKPVIFVNLLQVINTAMAIRLKETLTSVTSTHLTQVPIDENDCVEQCALING
ncbi:unnamed protein product [Parnassius apollo]|uniref:(apollo) hypothetical protein n=1 Tax=Parnassius apollo TaxID=110799 RepID=A0A8S3XPI3_PARAO|nr:unnamed protein product [Parnassius apollo]